MAEAWTPGRKPEVEAALRASRTRADAAARLGVTLSSLDRACAKYGLSPQSLLAWRPLGVEAPAPAPVKETGPILSDETPPPAIDWTGARPTSTGAGLERRLILSDTHFPYAIVRACAAIIAIARAIQPHEILHLGDAWNMGAVSRHPRPFGGRENHIGAQARGLAFFDALARAAPGARKRLFLGNHDDWAEEFEDQNPQFAGMFAAQSIGLDKLGWELVPRAAQPLVLGPVDYAHGTGGGEHYAKRYALHADTGARCHVRGHHHSMQHFQAKNGHEAWGAGFVADRRWPAFDYAKEKGHWEVGCLVQDVIGDRVTTTPVRLDGGAALFGGRLIAA